MARIRTVKPDLWQDEAIGEVSLESRLTFLGLITQADDYGRLKGSPKLVKAWVFPYDDFPLRKIQEWLRELHESGLIQVNGDEIELVEWRRFVGRPGRPNIPAWVRRMVIDRDGRRCGICGGRISTSERFHLDHIFPVALGGLDIPENLQVAHASCNRAKGARP